MSRAVWTALTAGALLFATGGVHASTPPIPTPKAAAAVAAFQAALMQATADAHGFGRAAIRLYWQAQNLAGYKGSAEDFERSLGAFYAELRGRHIARVTLGDGAWLAAPPPERLVLARGQADPVLLIVANSTRTAQSVTATLGGRGVKPWRRQLALPAGETGWVSIPLKVMQGGRRRLWLRVRGRHSVAVPIETDIRPAVLLHVEVDAPSGRPTATRVYLRGADGLSATPAGAFDREMWMTGEHYFYCDGGFTATLPTGPLHLEIRKGFDYRPIEYDGTLAAGAPVRMRFRLHWLRDMNADGWYGGDDHIHGNYTGGQWTTPAVDALAVRGEGLNVGDMKVSNGTGAKIHDERFFRGHPDPVSTPMTIVDWNQELRTGMYGHLVFLGLKQLVRPLYTGFPGTPHWEDYPSNEVLEERARRQGAAVIYAHPALRYDSFPTGSLAAEAVADVPLGMVDAFEVFCSHDEPSMALWYRFLNLGFRLGISGGSDAFVNQAFSFLPGGERVYAYTGRSFDYAAWVAAIRNERTFATVGPLLRFTVGGKMAGSSLDFAHGPAAVAIQASAVSTIPMRRLEVVANGRVVASTVSPMPRKRLAWRGVVQLRGSAWVALRIWGPRNDRIANGPSRWEQRRSRDVLLAHSSPIYVTVGGQRIYSPADEAYCLRWLDALTAEVRGSGKFASAAQRKEILATFARSREVYARLARQ